MAILGANEVSAFGKLPNRFDLCINNLIKNRNCAFLVLLNSRYKTKIRKHKLILHPIKELSEARGIVDSPDLLIK